MALMFQRLARNFAKNGYFPTDSVTMERIIQALDCGAYNVNLLDPCCGEGSALADIKHSIQGEQTDPVQHGPQVTAFGVEYDKERAWNAKKWLDLVAHSDVHDMAIKPRSMGLLFLNPPYGDLVTDQAGLDDTKGMRKRLEKTFFKLCHPWLAFDGILVLIVPRYVMDEEFASMIARGYRDVKVFMAPEQRFKQCVIFGVKRKSERIDPETQAKLLELNGDNAVAELPEFWAGHRYTVPPAKEIPNFVATRISADELALELDRLGAKSTLWSDFQAKFSAQTLKHRPPLRNLSRWHLALALAAGQVSGIVKSADGRILLVKGDTYKDKSVVTTFEEVDDQGTMREIRTSTDKFVPTIRAIDLTPHGLYGHLVTIQ
jgi:Uncharacterised methyltransferase family (DUF6094)